MTLNSATAPRSYGDVTLRRMIWAIASLGIGSAAIALGLFTANFWGKAVSKDPEIWSFFGGYMGGVLGPIVAFLGVVGLLVTLGLQQRQIQDGRRQLIAATRALNLEAYWKIEEYLQRKEVIQARGRLYKLCEEKNDPLGDKYGEWTEDEKLAVEEVCRSFNFIGNLAVAELFDSGFFVENWGRTVIRCWNRTEKFVKSRRQKEGNEVFWKHYDDLHQLCLKRWSADLYPDKSQPLIAINSTQAFP